MSLLKSTFSRRAALYGSAALFALSCTSQAQLFAQEAKPEAVPPAPPEEEDEWITTIGLSQDGRYLAAASTSHAIAIWETASGKLVRELVYPFTQNSVGALAFSEDGKTLLAGNGARRRTSRGHALLGFDIETGELSVERTIDIQWVGQFATSPKASVFATIGSGDDRSIRTWDKGGFYMERLWPAHDSTVRAIAMSHDGRRIATSGSNWRKTGRDPSIKIWDTATTRPIVKIDGRPDGAKALAFTPDGRQLVSAGEDAVKVWNTADGKLVRSLPIKVANEDSIGEMTLSPDASWYAMTVNDRDGKLMTYSIRSVSNGSVITTWTGSTQVSNELAAAPNGSALFVGGNGGVITQHDTKSGKTVRTFRLDDKPARAKKSEYDKEREKAAAQDAQ